MVLVPGMECITKDSVAGLTCCTNTTSREHVLSEWQFNHGHVFPSQSPSQGPATYRGRCQGESNGGSGVAALSAGTWLSEKEPFLHINETGSLERLTMAKRPAGMHAVPDVISGASVVRTQQIGPSAS